MSSGFALETGRDSTFPPIDGSIVGRGIACLLVVLVHANILIRPVMEDWWPGGMYFVPIFSVPVPFFFLLSGYSAGRGKAEALPPRTLRDRAKRLIPPFIFWNLILLLLDGRFRYPAGETIIYFLTGFWHLYFVFALLQLHLAVHLLGRNRIDGSPCRLFVISGLISFLFFAAADHVLWAGGGAAPFVETALNRLFFPWAIFFAGGFISRREPALAERIRRRAGLVVVILLVGYLAYVYELWLEGAWFGYNPLKQFLLTGFFFQCVASVAALAVIARRSSQVRSGRLSRFLAAAGRDSFGIYLAHPAVMLVLLSVYDRSSIRLPFDLEVPALCLGSLVGAWGITFVGKHLAWSWPGILLSGQSPGRNMRIPA